MTTLPPTTGAISAATAGERRVRDGEHDDVGAGSGRRDGIVGRGRAGGLGDLAAFAASRAGERDVVPGLGERAAERRANIAGADDCDLHVGAPFGRAIRCTRA